jgi:hypothetical protein
MQPTNRRAPVALHARRDYGFGSQVAIETRFHFYTLF